MPVLLVWYEQILRNRRIMLLTRGIHQWKLTVLLTFSINIIIKWSKQIHNINLSILKVCKARGSSDKAHDEDGTRIKLKGATLVLS